MQVAGTAKTCRFTPCSLRISHTYGLFNRWYCTYHGDTSVDLDEPTRCERATLGTKLNHPRSYPTHVCSPATNDVREDPTTSIFSSGGGTGYAGYAPAYLSDRHVLITYMYYISVFVLKKGKKSLGSQMTLYPSRKQEVRRPRRPVRGKVILGPSTFWLLSRSVDLLKKISIRRSELRSHGSRNMPPPD